MKAKKAYVWALASLICTCWWAYVILVLNLNYREAGVLTLGIAALGSMFMAYTGFGLADLPMPRKASTWALIALGGGALWISFTYLMCPSQGTMSSVGAAFGFIGVGFFVVCIPFIIAAGWAGDYVWDILENENKSGADSDLTNKR